MPALEQETSERLALIRDLAESGITELTGKGRREYGTEGAFVGRYGGLKPSFPELLKIKDSPKQIAAAIRRGSGPAYERVYDVVSKQAEREGYMPARRRSPGRPTVAPHEGRIYCKRCQDFHTKGQHRFHGPGSFHRTHLFSFGGNVKMRGNYTTSGDPSSRSRIDTVSHARQEFARLMKEARTRSLTDYERRELRRAAQLIRYSTRRTASGNKPRRRISRARASGLIRMGRLVELRYQRDHGTKPGMYKHPFTRRPTIYYRPSDDTIIIR
jgi:hypothetical protein